MPVSEKGRVSDYDRDVDTTGERECKCNDSSALAMYVVNV